LSSARTIPVIVANCNGPKVLGDYLPYLIQMPNKTGTNILAGTRMLRPKETRWIYYHDYAAVCRHKNPAGMKAAAGKLSVKSFKA